MKNIFHLILSFTLFSCVDAIVVDNVNNANLLIVEGRISSEVGPHKIRLSRSANYGDVFSGEITGEPGASIFIRDNLGNTEKLNEDGSGYYSTSDQFQGIVDREYTLFIITKDKQEYQSYPEKLSKVPAIEKLFYEFTELPSDGEPISGINIYSQFSDDINSSNFYKWEVGGTFLFKAHPELYMPPRSPVAVPKDCCSECYRSELINNISISKDRFYNGNISSQKVQFVLDDGARFYGKYAAFVAQMSISKDAFIFFNLLENQLSIQGNIFDPPPAQIRGNIINMTNPEEDVVGFFYASDITRDTLFVKGVDFPFRKSPAIIPDDCREVNGASTTVPDFW
jgi:hypothetical protein